MKITLAISAIAALGLSSGAVAQSRPDYYPAAYDKIVEGAKSEDPLLIYTNLSPEIWEKIIVGFHVTYPDIKIETVDLGSELFERYRAERSSGTKSADLIVTSASENWKEFMESDYLLDYKSAEADKLPEWASPKQGLYTVTADPMLILYNKFVVPESDIPKSIADMAALIERRPELKSKVTTYNIANPFGLALNWGYIARDAKNKDVLSALGAEARPERSAGPMFEKIGTGEYAMGYFVSSATTFSRLKDPARAAVVGWSFISDGNPLVLRGAGIPNSAKSVNSAKLMLDFLISVEGQKALGQGGVTPYRTEVKKADVANYTYSDIAEAVGGEDNIVLIGYDKPYLSDPNFMAEMRKIYPNAN